MDHAIACRIVCRSHRGTISADNYTTSLHDLEIVAFEGFYLLESLEVLCVHSGASDDVTVVLEHGWELFDVLWVEEGRKGASRQLCESFIGRGEDGERAFILIARECRGEIAGGEGGDKGREVGDGVG